MPSVKFRLPGSRHRQVDLTVVTTRYSLGDETLRLPWALRTHAGWLAEGAGLVVLLAARGELRDYKRSGTLN